MNARRFRQSVFLAAIPAYALACGSTDPVYPGGLTGSQIDAMVRALNDLGAFNFSASLADATPIAAGLGGQAFRIAADIPCSGGGAIHLAGTFATQSSGAQGAYTVDLVQTPNACASGEAGGSAWTFDGDPSVALHLQTLNSGAGGTSTTSGTFGGSLNWKSSDGATGSCQTDFVLSAHTQTQTHTREGIFAPTGQIQGTICGRHVDVHF